MKMKKTAKNYIANCEKYLGCKESNGSHRKIIDIFNSSKLKTFSVSYSDAWCAAFISAMAVETGMDKLIPISANCDEMYKKGTIMGIAIPKRNWIPKVGDIIFYDWNVNGELDHVGAVKSINGSGITVIEGNKNDSVSNRVINYKNGTITKILRPRYETEEKKPTYKSYCNAVLNTINGKYGNGENRKKKLESLGYDYNKVQKIVDILLK